ncbi:unnamed protein product [Diabrotica balteata]|uniref:mRNA-decapping enzyme C-terminal domain-containing protein n=1 Tax=Diabrotica balteata TaxID=107213 RepID=A0A9N9T706_DIABA|nr:unnamed protein product [Diabrotica balteata]
MQAPFLLYRNSKSKIFGIWFFNREECIRITVLVESIMKGLKDTGDEKSKKKGNNVDIFSMLSKAQEDFNRTPTKQDAVPTFSSTPRVPDVTSQSVMDFFAKASTNTGQKPVNTEENVLQIRFLLVLLDSQKPHLMTPMMFTTPKPKDNLDSSTTDADQIDLLTEKQLAQALIYLLKNNADFTKQIHEAYVKSIMEKVNLSTSKSFI